MAVKDIIMIRGDTLTIPIVLKNRRGETLDLRGYRFRFTVKKNYADEVPSIEVDEVVDPNNTEPVYTVLLKIQTRSLQAGTYVYDLEMTDTQEIVKTLLIGKLVLEPDVSRS